MQSFYDDDQILLTLYCKDPSSGSGPDCPAFYKTTRGDWTAQGERTDEEVTSQLIALKPSETSVMLPDALVDLFCRRYVREKYGVDIPGAPG